LSYNINAKLQNKIPNFKINIGFGLHYGWAIEGAIGSTFKIDASYLSPNVNLAARLEAATKQYDVKILISGRTFDLLSKDLNSFCRLIDIVTVKGSLIPMRLYTVDLNEDKLKPYKKLKKNFSNKLKREKQNKIKNIYENELKNFSLTKKILNKKQFMILLKNGRTCEFKEFFDIGFNFYICGNWIKATEFFKKCLYLYQNDGPTKNLLKFIKENDFKAPNDWKGYRNLTSK